MEIIPYFKKAIFVLRYQGFKALLVKVAYFLKKKGKGQKQLYFDWIEKNENFDFNKQARESKIFHKRPLFSILTATFNVSPAIFKETYDSVLGQTYPFWEWCIVDASKDETKKFIEDLVRSDKRIKFRSLEKNLGIAGNLKEAEAMAKGDYFVFLDHDDLLRPNACFEAAKMINKEGADFIYSDEDKVGFDGKRVEPYFKPDWSPHLLTSFNYINHLTVISASLFNQVGGFRLGFDGAQDYDLYLRATKAAKHISHIPAVLYSWRKTRGSTATSFFEKSYAEEAGKKALEAYLEENKIEGTIEETVHSGIYRLKRKLLENPAVSIIIPTCDKKDYLEKCISSVLKSEYQNFEIIIVDNRSKEEPTLEYFKELSKNPKIKILEYDKPFNYSSINNFAVSKTKNPYLLFLNNDTEVITFDWLESMLQIAQEESVAIVAPKLLFSNNTVQNFGVVVGLGGIAGSVFQGFPKGHQGCWGNLVAIRDVSAVSAAVMLMKRKVFEEIGGFDENIKVSFSDIDLCLKVRGKNYSIVITSYAHLYHKESATRGYEYKGEELKNFQREIDYFGKKWKNFLQNGDPFYNKNLSLEHSDYRLDI